MESQLKAVPTLEGHSRSFPVPHVCKFPRMGRAQGSPGCHAMGGSFEGVVDRLLQTNRILLDIYLPD
eukprot:10289608-Alexandrium_andersonii.AAC.1